MAEKKVYALLPRMDATAPIYQTVPGGKRIRITKIPVHRPFMQVSFQEDGGNNRTIRYKANMDEVFQDEQIKKGVLANEKFTTNDYSNLVFRSGILITDKTNVQKFLEVHPENAKFTGSCNDVQHPTFELVDRDAKIKSSNADLKKRAKTAVGIFELTLEQAHASIIRIYGSAMKLPILLDDAHQILVNYLDTAEGDDVDAILKTDEDLNIDEQTKILIGRLINQGTLSFDREPGKISKKINDGSWIDVRSMSNEYPREEKIRLFSDFLNTTDGKALKTDFESDLKDGNEAAPTASEPVRRGRKPSLANA